MPKPKLKAWIKREDPVARSARALWCRMDKTVAAQFKKSRYVEPVVSTEPEPLQEAA